MSVVFNTTELERCFPWRCPKCGRKEVRRETVSYHCERLQDGQPVTVNIPNLKVPRCGACGELVFDHSAEEQINAAYNKPISQASANGAARGPESLADAGKGELG